MKKSKNILILDTNISSLPIVNSLGDYRVSCIGNNPLDSLVTEEYNYKKVNYSKRHKLIKHLDEYSPDYVVPGCNDKSYEMVAGLNISKKYTHNITSGEALNTLVDKAAFKSLCNKLNIPTPKKLNIDKNNRGCKIIVKPVDSFSGKGISIVDGNDQPLLKGAIERAEMHSQNGKVVTEEFIDGNHYSYSCFIREGKILSDFVVRELFLYRPFAVDHSFCVYGYQHLPLLRKWILDIATELDLCDGLLHVQFVEGSDGIKFLEITRRCPGDLYSALIHLSTGVNYASLYVKPFLGVLNKSVNYSKQQVILRKTFIHTPEKTFTSLGSRETRYLIRFYPYHKAGQGKELERFGIGFYLYDSFRTMLIENPMLR